MRDRLGLLLKITELEAIRDRSMFDKIFIALVGGWDELQDERALNYAIDILKEKANES